MIEKRFCGVQRLGLGVARRRRAVEQVEVHRPVLHALAQHVDDAALADLAGEAGEELEAVDVLGVVRVGHRQLLERLGLGGAQEGEELRHVERVGAVVVLRAAGGVAGAAVGRRPLGDRVRDDGETVRAGHVPHDERFEALLAGVGGHTAASSSAASVSSLRSVVVLDGVERRFVGQPRRRLAHIELAGHHVGDEAGAVFAEEFDLAFEAGDGGVELAVASTSPSTATCSSRWSGTQHAIV